MKELSSGIKVALLIMMVVINYCVAVTFIPMPETGNEHAKTIVPFLLGVLATLIGFYWGNKHEKELPPAMSKEEEAAKMLAANIESERIEAAKEEADKKEAVRIEAAKVTAAEVIETAKKEEAKP